MEKKNLTILRKINFVFWLVLIVVLMLAAHHAWSQYGPYTLGSFIRSLFIHGCIPAFFGCRVDEWLRNKVSK